MAAADTSAPPAPTSARAQGSGVVNLLKFGPDPLAFLTRLGHGSPLGVVPVRVGNLTLRLVTDPPLGKRALELDDPPRLRPGPLPRGRAGGREGDFFLR